MYNRLTAVTWLVIGMVAGVALFYAIEAFAFVRYAPTSAIQPNTITGTQILDGTITGADISTSASTTQFRLQVSDLIATSTTATSTFLGGFRGVNNFTIQSTTGNVGIKSANPATTLDVQGIVNIGNGHGLRWANGNVELVNTLYDILFRTYDGVANLREVARLSSAGNFGIGTTSPYSRLSVAGNVVASTFLATSTTATSTFSGGFVVSGTASTTNMVISGNCVGCFAGYQQITNTCALNGASPSTCNITLSCPTGKVVMGGGTDGTSGGAAGIFYRIDSYPSATTTWQADFSGPNGATDTMRSYAICITQ